MPETATTEAIAAGRPREDRASTSPCMAKLDRLAWVARDWFEIEGYRFGVRSTSERFGAWVKYVLRAYRAPGPLDPTDDPLYSFVIAEPGTEASTRNLHILYVGTLDVVRTFDLGAIGRAFVSEVETLTFPLRDDAVYIEASVIRGPRATAVIPTWMVPPINAAGRQIRRELEVELPCALSVALDPSTGYLVPVRPTLDLPADALEILSRSWPAPTEADARAFVERETPIDRVVVIGGGPDAIGVHPISRGPVLFDVARSIRNLPKVRGDGPAAVGRALAGAEAARAQWANTQQLVGVVSAVVGERVDAAGRPRATVGV